MVRALVLTVAWPETDAFGVLADMFGARISGSSKTSVRHICSPGDSSTDIRRRRITQRAAATSRNVSLAPRSRDTEYPSWRIPTSRLLPGRIRGRWLPRSHFHKVCLIIPIIPEPIADRLGALIGLRRHR